MKWRYGNDGKLKEKLKSSNEEEEAKEKRSSNDINEMIVKMMKVSDERNEMIVIMSINM